MSYPAGTGGGNSGTVTNVTGTAPISVATGTSTPVVSLDALGVTTAKIAANAVTAAKIAAGSTYLKFANGKSGAGNFTVTGVKAGDVITSVLNLGNPGAGDNTITSQFTALIASDNTIHQLVVTDYSMSALLFYIVAKGGGA